MGYPHAGSENLFLRVEKVRAPLGQPDKHVKHDEHSADVMRTDASTGRYDGQ